MSKESKISRRKFLRGTAATAASVVVASSLPVVAAAQSAQPWLPAKWDYEADVVIVGYGGSGAVTAMTAHDAGAKVLVIEKAPIEGGGSTRMSTCATLWIKPEDTQQAADYMYGMSWGATSKEECLAWAKEMYTAKEFLDKIGAKYTEGGESAGVGDYPQVPGAKAIRSLAMTGKGPAYWPIIDKQVKSRAGIQVLFDTPGKSLIQDGITKEILGVRATQGGKEIAIKAKRAVVLSTGGFECNIDMVRQYLQTPTYVGYGTPFNTGDGIKMAQAVGADLWHMRAAGGRACIKVPEYKSAFSFRAPVVNGYFFTDKHGSRYGAEGAEWIGHSWWWLMTQFHPDIMEYPNIPTWMIFDEKTRLAGPISRPDVGICTVPKELGGAPMWSNDSSEEIKKGWVKKGDTIEALATVIKADPAVLKATLAKYNGFCANKKDEDFGRPSTSLVPLATPPYYAVELSPVGGVTYGGPKPNEKHQIVGVDGKPIPRLYSSGTMGMISGFLYTSGLPFTSTITTSLVAGKNAAAEKPWGAT